ncbi:LacI family DNA-binding transcriptional regulator [Plebeiibacterium sediminum]|uniref:LacI family transcriptional regulator n=1 Tax=Plebeiibacterium sediminum TaxID=2992112 RepID=A0AAE3SGW6_9BACT|nr:LacI family DNA-binding transcriptional regulator [Plebeiobacterium sediminum]MCW3788552.1 LacI family transcriptional regulator [Plebeiobacterium sediminum]
MTKISINKIAELAGVSKTTVSFVLNGRGDEKNISQKTQEKILAVARENNYKANYIARSLSLGKSFTIGFIVPDISNPFFGKIAKQIETVAEKKGYSVMVANTNEDVLKETNIIESFKARQIDGIILASASKNYNQLTSIIGKDYPSVFFDRFLPNMNKPFIGINNFETAQQLTELLIQKGHKKIALVSITSYLPNIVNRINGYKDALTTSEIGVNEDLIFEIEPTDIKNGIKQVISNMVEGENPTTAILFLNNVLTAEAIWTVNTLYPEYKDQLDFASFDNLDLFDYSTPRVISALQPSEDIANLAVNMLCDQIDNNNQHEGIQLDTSIITR